jgi:Flp pilus assembly pilin Flp
MGWRDEGTYKYVTPWLPCCLGYWGTDRVASHTCRHTHGYRREHMLRLWTGFQSRIIREEEGAELVEYLLLVSLIAIVAMVAVVTIGTQLTDSYTEIASSVPQ